MAIQTIANQLRSLRDRYWSLVADALRDIEQIVSNIYRDMGWFRVTDALSGIRKDILESKLFSVLSGGSGEPVLKVFAEQNRILVSPQRNLAILVKDFYRLQDMLVSPGGISVNGQPPTNYVIVAVQGSVDTAGDFISSISANGGTSAGYLATRLIDSTKLRTEDIATFVDPVDGDTVIRQAASVGSSVVEIKKGANNIVSISVDKTAVVVTISDGTNDTTIKPESVVTPRLGVGASAPGTNGHAVVNTFLGAGSTAPSSGEALRVGGNARVDSNLGIGMNPSRALDVTGDGKLTGSLEVDGAAQFDGSVTVTGLAAGGTIVGQVGGTLSTLDAGTARFYLDVYTKAEVDAEIAAAIAAAMGSLSVDSVADHDHGGAVAAGGGHSHTITYTP